MRLRSAYDDLMERTMGAVSGILGRLRFLGSIQSSRNEYEHWGLERTYGKEPARCAIRKAHTEALLEELSTPIAALWSEGISAAERENMPATDYARSLATLINCVPGELCGGSEKHHQYVIMSLVLLFQTHGLTTRQAA